MLRLNVTDINIPVYNFCFTVRSIEISRKVWHFICVRIVFTERILCAVRVSNR